MPLSGGVRGQGVSVSTADSCDPTSPTWPVHRPKSPWFHPRPNVHDGGAVGSVSRVRKVQSCRSHSTSVRFRCTLSRRNQGTCRVTAEQGRDFRAPHRRPDRDAWGSARPADERLGSIPGANFGGKSRFSAACVTGRLFDQARTNTDEIEGGSSAQVCTRSVQLATRRRPLSHEHEQRTSRVGAA